MKALASQATEALLIRVHGAVQGVGFRPFIYRLARQHGLRGSVRNAAEGVIIVVEGVSNDIRLFQERLLKSAPPQSRIESTTAQSIPPTGATSFVIKATDSQVQPRARLPRDLVTCAECRREVFDKRDRRGGYPFTNCTTCGPRYSIIEAMPYDRAATSMSFFETCPACYQEYHSPDDRRFHAQPNACSTCGPQVQLWDKDGKALAGPEEAIFTAAEFLRRGQVIALKGVGGFQLLVRADDAHAVRRLRTHKHRPSKPLAVMVQSLAGAENLAALGAIEGRLLTSAGNPIVLVSKRGGGHKETSLAEEIAPGVRTLGLFLPTTPLHHLLLSELGGPLVATSGNRCEEPIVTDERHALRELAGIADVFLVHDRPIIRRVDDSVARVIAGKETVFRLARGYAPLPLPSLEADAASLPVLATGGHQKSAIALWTGAQAVLAQHIGDLDQHATRLAFADTTRDLGALYQCAPQVLACDLHPDHFTTRWALAQKRPVVQVQHHHAHAVSCMVEHDLLDREVLAMVWDGTGYGTDGVIWGGEILRATSTGFQHVASLLPFPLPGGEAAIRHPNRTAFGLLWVAMGMEGIVRDHDLLRRLGLTPREAVMMDTMIRRGLNTPWTSSVGRLFDGIAALALGTKDASYEGEPAVLLEAVAASEVSGCYTLPLRQPAECQDVVGDRSIWRGDWRPMLSAILDDVSADVEPGIIAARFHNALAQWANAVAAQHPLLDLVLSGGCFQNRLLTERTLEVLRQGSRRVHTHGSIPPGDGGLAVGQLAVALAQRRQSAN